MTPDLDKLIRAIELKIAALDINGQQAVQAFTVQVSELIDQAAEAAGGMAGFGQRLDDVERGLNDRLDQVRQLTAQLERLVGSTRSPSG